MFETQIGGSDWVRYSDYELQEINGSKYICPTKNAKLQGLIPTNSAKPMIFICLNLGWHIIHNKLTDDELHGHILQFAKSFGTMGIDTPFVMDTDGTFTAHYKKIFSKDYKEKVDSIIEFCKEIYTHFNACKKITGEQNPIIKKEYEKIIDTTFSANIVYKTFWDEGLYLYLKMPTLKDGIITLYNMALTAFNSELRMCKKCEKAFFAEHGREEFCSPQCRNQYNVYKSRAKKKE